VPTVENILFFERRQSHLREEPDFSEFTSDNVMSPVTHPMPVQTLSRGNFFASNNVVKPVAAHRLAAAGPLGPPPATMTSSISAVLIPIILSVQRFSLGHGCLDSPENTIP
jgi:hypothetical protein